MQFPGGSHAICVMTNEMMIECTEVLQNIT
jgi:hypothetical protein